MFVAFGDGTIQRSKVRRMVVTFSETVSFSGPVVNAFTLRRTGTEGAIGDVALTANPPTGPTNSVTITFSGLLTEGGGSLVDGFYNLTIDALQVTTINGTIHLDGDGNGISGDNYSVTGTIANRFFRLFGDGDGNGIVNQTDFIDFRNAFNNGPSDIFDYEGDGNISQTDFIQFRNRFNVVP